MIDKGMCIGALPGRKSKALWIEEHGKIETLAWFVDERSYERFKRLISGRGLVEVPTTGAYSGSPEQFWNDGCWGDHQPTLEGRISDGR
jgi:hypothetical protein